MTGGTDTSGAPLVTIAIPTYNRAGRVVEAVRQALAQDLASCEVVVSDDASTDGTAAALELVAADAPPGRLRILRQSQNLGMIPNWNACIAASRGRYVLVLGDDDGLEPACASRLAATLEADDALPFAFCRTRVHDEVLGVSWETPAGPDRYAGRDLVLDFFRAAQFPVFSAILFRATTLRAAGGFHAGYPFAADAAAWMPMALESGAGHVPETLCHHRIHGANVTHLLGASATSRDEARLVELVARAWRRRGGSPEEIRELREAGSRHVARASAQRLLEHAIGGASRTALARGAWEVLGTLAGDPVRALPRAAAALLLPAGLLCRLRRSRSGR